MPEATVSRTPIFNAHPTLRVDGQVDERLSALLVAMAMDESEGGMSTLTLKLENSVGTDGPPELAFDATSRLKLGAELKVGTGDRAAPAEVFRGKVSALELLCETGKMPMLVVLAEDGLASARRHRRSAVYANMSPADVVNRIASGLGLTPNISGLTSPIATWAQINETDLGFLRRLLARFDIDLQVVGTDLQVAPHRELQRSVIDLALDSQLSRVRATADLADQATTVSLAGWDAVQGAAVASRITSIDDGGPGRGRSGVDWLQGTFGDRQEHLARPAVGTQAEADAVAQAAFDQRARRFVRVEAVAEGNLALRVGSHVRLSGLSPQFDNTYFVQRCSHRFDLVQGYRVEFGAECAYLGN